MKKLAAILILILIFAACLPPFACAEELDILENQLATILTYDETKPVGTLARQQIDQIKRRAVDYGNYPGNGKLWEDLAPGGAGINAGFSRVLTMAEGYRMGADVASQVKDKVAMLCNAGFYPGVSTKENWWYYEIGIPQSLAKIVLLMGDAYTEAERNQLCETILYFCPSAEYRKEYPAVKETGANRLWKAELLLYCGVAMKRTDIIVDAVKACDEVFLPVKRLDGFYQDGSFIQHDRVAYTGAYGTSLANSLVDIAYGVRGTRYGFSQEQIEVLQGWAEEAFAPLMKNGAMMAMVRGRAIARNYETDHTTGHGVLHFFARLSELSDAKGRLQSFVKTQAAKDGCASLGGTPATQQIMEAIAEDSSIPIEEEGDRAKIYASMDRAVFARRGVKFGISMSSSRIYNYESINDENLHGYHTGNGMTYLYNEDSRQYEEGYWCTVDPYRLGGTTVDDTQYSDGEGSCSLSAENWCGGVELDGKYGAAGMSIHPYKTGLTGRKSWFCIGDEFIALGAGITNTRAGSTTETIVENRKIKNETVVVNGNPMEEDLFQSYNTYWMHVDGGEGNRTGYYYPGQAAVTLKRETRTGNWSAIRKATNKTETNRFFSAVINHRQAANAGYAYAILPERTAEQTRNYARTPEFEILENSKSIQAVRGKTRDITAVNFWEAGSIGGIKTDHSASVVVLEDGDEIRIALSDPERSAEKAVRLELEKRAKGILSRSESVKVLALSPKIILEVDTSELLGTSGRIVLSKTAFGSFSPVSGGAYLTPDLSRGTVTQGQAELEKDQAVFSRTGMNRVEYTLEKPMDITAEQAYLFAWEQYVGSDLGGNGALNGQDGQYLCMNTTIMGGLKKNGAGQIKPFLWWYRLGGFGERTIEENTWYQMRLIVELHTERRDKLSLYVTKTGEIPSGIPDVEVEMDGGAAWETIALACRSGGTGNSVFRNFTIQETGAGAKELLALIQNAAENEKDGTAARIARQACGAAQDGLGEHCRGVYAGFVSKQQGGPVALEQGDAWAVFNGTKQEEGIVRIEADKRENKLNGVQLKTYCIAPGTVISWKKDPGTQTLVWESLDRMKPVPLILEEDE